MAVGDDPKSGKDPKPSVGDVQDGQPDQPTKDNAVNPLEVAAQANDAMQKAAAELALKKAHRATHTAFDAAITKANQSKTNNATADKLVADLVAGIAKSNTEVNSASTAATDTAELLQTANDVLAKATSDQKVAADRAKQAADAKGAAIKALAKLESDLIAARAAAKSAAAAYVAGKDEIDAEINLAEAARDSAIATADATYAETINSIEKAAACRAS